MIPRSLQPRILAALHTFPVVALVGARQTGKTTLAHAVAAQLGNCLHLDLERPSDLAKLADAELFLQAHHHRLVILDEVQRRPDLFPILRALVDETARPGRFLVLGSASPQLLRQTSESLAGRIISFELGPFTWSELATQGTDPRTLWLRGGFPRSTLAASELASFDWRQAFIATYLERDLPQLGVRVPASTLRRFWLMLAHLHGQLWNASDVARSLGVSSPTISHYLSIFEDTFLVRRLPPYHANIAKRLVKRPRVYIRDSGLLHALLRITDMDSLFGHPILGKSWEGFAIEQIFAEIPSGWEPFFYRTASGAEIDLVLHTPGSPPIPVEITASLAPRLEPGFKTAFSDLGARHGYCIYAGNEVYPLTPSVLALPLAQIERIFQRP